MTDSNRREPEELTNEELLKRIARKDRSKYNLPEIAQAALNHEDDS